MGAASIRLRAALITGGRARSHPAPGGGGSNIKGKQCRVYSIGPLGGARPVAIVCRLCERPHARAKGFGAPLNCAHSSERARERESNANDDERRDPVAGSSRPLGSRPLDATVPAPRLARPTATSAPSRPPPSRDSRLATPRPGQSRDWRPRAGRSAWRRATREPRIVAGTRAHTAPASQLFRSI